MLAFPTFCLVLPAIAQKCVPSAPDGYGKSHACTVTIERDNPASPPNLVVHGGTTVTIVVNQVHGNENITFTPATSGVAMPDIAGTFLKSAISPLQQLTVVQLSVPAERILTNLPAGRSLSALNEVIGKLDVVWKQLQSASNQLACLEAGKGFAGALCSAQFQVDGFAPARDAAAVAMFTAAKAELPLADLRKIEGDDGLKKKDPSATSLELTLDALATSIVADIQKAQASMQEQADLLRSFPEKGLDASYTIKQSALHTSSVTVVAQEVISKANTTLAAVTISWQSNPWEISTGIMFSALKNQSYSSVPLIVNGVPAPDPAPANSGKTLTVVKDSYTKPTVIAPLVMANYRLGFMSHWGWENKCPNHCAFLLSGGVGLNVIAKTADFAAGPSFQIGAVLFTVGTHIGRDVELSNGVAVGSKLGSSPPSPLPTSVKWTAKLGFAVSYALPFQ
jgi:hypothetical protein